MTWRNSTGAAIAVAVASLAAAAEPPVYYAGVDASGEFRWQRQTTASPSMALKASGARYSLAQAPVSMFKRPEHLPGVPGKQLHPPIEPLPLSRSYSSAKSRGPLALSPFAAPLQAAQQQRFLGVMAGGAGGFDGLTDFDQRYANNGNQYSSEPPSPSIAVANGYVLEGVNNAIQVYNVAGQPLLPKVLSTNELFGVTPAIDDATGINGVYPTDMRVFYDRDVDRWFVLQRAEDYDVYGYRTATSHMYLAVSRTGDPTGAYNVYVAETTHWDRQGCPCFSDYPQIGADQYGFYISVGEYRSLSTVFVGATIYAISKVALATGELTPRTYKYELPFTMGYEFAIQPAVTPPGASYFLAAGGLEYFASTMGKYAAGNVMGLWAMSNTSALATGIGMPSLMRVPIPTMPYIRPDIATQPPGFRPYGMSLIPPGPLPFIDAGDTRLLSLIYAGGRLHATLSTAITDGSGRTVTGAAYLILAPTYRGGIPNATVVNQYVFAVEGNHLLRPAVGVDARGRGAIAVTLVGPDWYPSAAYIPIDPLVEANTVRVVGSGALPEDGFTGYNGTAFPEVARWGDYSSAFVAQGGSVWVLSEYIGPKPRSHSANWGTFIAEVKP